jgi:hypothetical protein
MLCLLDITLKLRTVAIFVVVDLLTIFIKYSSGLCPFKFILHYCNLSFIIAITI